MKLIERDPSIEELICCTSSLQFIVNSRLKLERVHCIAETLKQTILSFRGTLVANMVLSSFDIYGGS